MTSVLVIAEHLGGKLNPSTAKCVTGAASISGATIDVVVLAADSAAVAQEAAALSGVRTVLRMDNPANLEPIAAVLAPQIAKLAAQYTHVFGPSTTFGKDLMPRPEELKEAGRQRCRRSQGAYSSGSCAVADG